MLAYIEKKSVELASRERTALAATRLWASAMRARVCPVPALQDMLQRFSAAGAVWPAHNLLSWVAEHATRSIDLGCPCCGRVSDDEALLLSAMFAPETATTRAALHSLVSPPALGRAVRLAQALGAELTAQAEN